MEAFRKVPRFSSHTSRPPLMALVFGDCWLFVSRRTGHRADLWLNPPHCDEWRGRNRSWFCCRGSSLCKTFPPSLWKAGARATSTGWERKEKIKKTKHGASDSLSEEPQWLSPVNHVRGRQEGFSCFSHLMSKIRSTEWYRMIYYILQSNTLQTYTQGKKKKISLLSLNGTCWTSNVLFFLL